jgi:TPR repeat protein
VDQGEVYLLQGKYQEALAELAPHVKKGDAKACFFTSLIKLFSEKPEQEEGLQLLQYAANKGFNPALDTLAGLYLHGEFVPQDRFQALRYYEMAARRGYGPSQFNCGIMYKNGDKIPQDLESAFVYLSMAALNKKDLDELTIDAAHYRDEVAKLMNKEQYQRAIKRMNQVS